MSDSILGIVGAMVAGFLCAICLCWKVALALDESLRTTVFQTTFLAVFIIFGACSTYSSVRRK